MIWGKNKRGERIGILNWTYAYLAKRHQANVLGGEVLRAANQVKRDGARSLVIIVQCNPRERE